MSPLVKLVRTVLLVAVTAFVIYVRIVAPPTTTPAGSTSPSSSPAAASAPAATAPATGAPAASASPAEAGVPQKAIDVLKIVRTTGQPPDGYVGGRVFENRENRLPADGDYREFDVDPHNGQRNAERLIVEWKTKKAWYTGDHYQTFTELP
jgi:ribonuclease T1